jgi:diguanylate cyclase
MTRESLRDVLETRQRLQFELSAAQRQIEEQAVRLRAAEQDARIDYLTRLPNRRAFDEHLAGVHSLFERNGMAYTLMLFDVDRFKSVNDAYGHAAGDAVLQVMAKVMQTRLRLSDKVFRLGGEEFAMVLAATTRQQAAVVAERMRKRIEAAVVHFEGCELRFTASIGAAEIEVNQSSSELLERADEALYAAKEAGRNCVEIAPALNTPFEDPLPEVCS